MSEARTPAELAFFGRMAASISHELKNQLAIVKEQAGLIGDLLAMAERGGPLDPGRLKDLAQRVSARADAMDEIIRRLNRFSHSVDEPVRTFDVSEALITVGEISRRLAAMSRVRLELQPAPGQVQITNDPFLIHHLLFRAIECAVAAAGPDGLVRAEVKDAGDSVRVEFGGGASVLTPGEELAEVLVRSGAAVEAIIDPPGLAVVLPKDLHRL